MADKKVVTASKIPTDAELKNLYEKLTGRRPTEEDMLSVRKTLAAARSEQENRPRRFGGP
jgi:hypothetical protein